MPEMPRAPEDVMFQEAQTALGSGDRARARDLLTRLIKADAANSLYWVWMSAAVETSKERIYCLNEALKHDPQNLAARRGLIGLGALPPDPALVIPLEKQRRDWESALFSGPGSEKDIAARTLRQLLILGGSVLGLVALVILVIFLVTRERPAAPPPAPLPTLGFYSTPIPSATPQPPGATPTLVGSMRLLLTLSATYTPTPLYVNTSHPIEDFRSARNAFLAGNYATAEVKFQSALTSDKSPDIWYYLGESLRMQKKYKEAVTAYESAIKANDKFAPAYLGRARAYRAQDPNLPAIQPDLEKAISLDSNLNEAILELVSLKIARKDAAGALQDLQDSAKIDPDSPLLYLYRAQAELLNNQPDLALQDARLANQMDVTLLPAYRALGQALQLSHQVSDSAAPLEIYTSFISDDRDAWYWLALAETENDNLSAALQAYNQVITLDKLSFDAYLGRGQLLLEMGDGAKAAADFRTALLIRNNSFSASLYLGRALMESGNLVDAADQFNQAFQLVQDDSEKAAVYYYRAQAQLKLRNTLTAIQSFELLLKLPAISVPEAWAQEAQAQLRLLYTPTPTPTVRLTSTSTSTPILKGAGATRSPTPSPSPSVTRSSTPTP